MGLQVNCHCRAGGCRIIEMGEENIYALLK